MNKDEHGLVQALLSAFSEECSKRFPELSRPVEDDMRRLLRLTETRGLRTLMIDCPDGCKVLDKGLSSGYLDSSKLPKCLGSWKNGTYIMYAVLIKMFDESGILRDEFDPDYVLYTRQIFLMWKKIRKDPSDEAIASSVAEFNQIENDLRNPDLDWDYDDLGETIPRFDWPLEYMSRDCQFRRRIPRRLLDVFRTCCERTIAQFPEFLPYTIIPKHGPGAVSDLSSNEDKYLFPNWSARLDGVFPHEFFTRVNDNSDLTYDSICNQEEIPCKLMAVPKTLKGPRLIASEPTANQWCQQGIMRWIREYLPGPLRNSIDFLDQLPSREAALAASIHGMSATVDLSSASDRLSCWTVERVFRSNYSLLRALHAVRSSLIASGIENCNFTPYRMKKFAAMGSAVTFPIQSIVYALCCYAAIAYDTGADISSASLWRISKRVRVFGDDIILPSHSVESLVLLLQYLQLEVNASKTHWKGHFRESCGIDAWRGYDVSPTYLSDLIPGQKPSDLVSWVAVSNNFHRNGFWTIAGTMWDHLPSVYRKWIPTSNTDLGVIRRFTFTPGTVSTKRRFNKNLQREEILGFKVSTRESRKRRESYSNLLQYFIEVPRPDLDWESGYICRNRLKISRRWVPSS